LPLRALLGPAPARAASSLIPAPKGGHKVIVTIGGAQ
jgi:hypothetical protein